MDRKLILIKLTIHYTIFIMDLMAFYMASCPFDIK